MLNPFYIFLLLFYRLRCGYVKPFIFFSFWFYILPGGYVKPFSCTFIFGFICYIVGM